MSKLLPPDFDERVTEAVTRFWLSRDAIQVGGQEGGRGSVIGGKNMDGICELIRDVALHCGCPKESIILDRQKLTLPGYFRPTKNWDALIVHRGHLLAVFELKSQVGPSFGNNFNNRAEESVGSSHDIWTAYRENAFSMANSVAHSGEKDLGIQPFLGFLMLLEHIDASTRAVRSAEPHFKVFPEFGQTSYLERYRILCEKLVTEKLYTSTCLIASPKGATGPHLSPSPAVSPRTFFAAFAGALSGALAALEG